jgi:RNA polymerase-binding transcription factor DksA
MLVGRFGVCQRCDAQIPLQRLYAIPQTALCGDCHRNGGAGRPAVSGGAP